MKVGLYFGTFNPIHVGHLIIANHMVEFSDLEEVWFVVTPQSPHKAKQSLLDNHHRYAMVSIAVEDYPKLRPSNIEFKLSQPNYTAHTLVHLSEKFPKKEFSLIMGEDNLKTFHKWKNYEAIIDHHQIYVYPRIGGGIVSNQFRDHPKVNRIDAPIIQISSTHIRSSIQQGKNIKPLLPNEVWRYMDEMNFYKN
jgi:nicotinate-nucleotide adenylyltransferase